MITNELSVRALHRNQAEKEKLEHRVSAPGNIAIVQQECGLVMNQAVASLWSPKPCNRKQYQRRKTPSNNFFTGWLHSAVLFC